MKELDLYVVSHATVGRYIHAVVAIADIPNRLIEVMICTDGPRPYVHTLTVRGSATSDPLTTNQLRGISLVCIVAAVLQKSQRQPIADEVVEPGYLPSGRARRTDEYLASLVAHYADLRAAGHKNCRTLMAAKFGRTESQIRDDLTAAQRRGLLKLKP